MANYMAPRNGSRAFCCAANVFFNRGRGGAADAAAAGAGLGLQRIGGEVVAGVDRAVAVLVKEEDDRACRPRERRREGVRSRREGEGSVAGRGVAEAAAERRERRPQQRHALALDVAARRVERLLVVGPENEVAKAGRRRLRLRRRHETATEAAPPQRRIYDHRRHRRAESVGALARLLQAAVRGYHAVV